MLAVPPFRQSDDSLCGPACLKMVLAYYGIEADEQEIAKRCSHTYELGCDSEHMAIAARSYGLIARIIFECVGFKEIEYCLQQKVPVIVDWFTGGFKPELGDMPNGHSSVVVDIDPASIYLLDPEFAGIRKIARDEFLRVWFDWRIEKPWMTEPSDLILREMLVIQK